MKYTVRTAVGAILALSSCAPKAVVIAETQPPKVETKTKVEDPQVSQEPIPALPDEGFRMPDVLGLPDDKEFRSSGPITPRTGGDGGGVIARPPTDPPSRVKPKPAGQE